MEVECASDVWMPLLECEIKSLFLPRHSPCAFYSILKLPLHRHSLLHLGPYIKGLHLPSSLPNPPQGGPNDSTADSHLFETFHCSGPIGVSTLQPAAGVAAIRQLAQSIGAIHLAGGTHISAVDCISQLGCSEEHAHIYPRHVVVGYLEGERVGHMLHVVHVVHAGAMCQVPGTRKEALAFFRFEIRRVNVLWRLGMQRGLRFEKRKHS